MGIVITLKKKWKIRGGKIKFNKDKQKCENNKVNKCSVTLTKHPNLIMKSSNLKLTYYCNEIF